MKKVSIHICLFLLVGITSFFKFGSLFNSEIIWLIISVILLFFSLLGLNNHSDYSNTFPWEIQKQWANLQVEIPKEDWILFPYALNIFLTSFHIILFRVAFGIQPLQVFFEN